MDLASAHALLLACKHSPVQGILLRAYKEEAREYAREPPRQAPAGRCKATLGGLRGGARCSGRVPEIAVAQFCAYHQRTYGLPDNHLNWARIRVASSPGRLRLLRPDDTDDALAA